jgi:site-specific DNA-methyltransferase (cytosine-N4-specific)
MFDNSQAAVVPAVLSLESPRVDLDFAGYRGVSVHPYPATMPYPLAEDLVRRWSRPGHWIVDPFVGSGTTVRAAAANERLSLGIDLNPLATLIARITAAPFDVQTDISKYDWARRRVLDLITNDVRLPAASWSSRLHRWFLPQVSLGLAQLAEAIARAGFQGPLQDFILVAFSRTVRKCSLARPGELKLWRRRSVQRHIEASDVFSLEATDLLWSIVALQSYRPIRTALKPTIRTADAADALADVRGCDLVLTSPPYGDAWTTVAYGNFSLLSRIWLSALDTKFAATDPGLEDAGAPGGRARKRIGTGLALFHRSITLLHVYDRIVRSNPGRAQELLAFFQDMNKILSLFRQTVRRNGRIVLVLGPRRVSGTWVDTGTILGELLGVTAFVHEARETRRITGKRLPTKTKQGQLGIGETINEETIDVFRRVR